MESGIDKIQEFDFTDHSHRRYNPLKGGYVLCSPHRSKRPWQGSKEEIKKGDLVSYDAKCYLCPGNVRASGEINPKYETTYIFRNDYSALKGDQPQYDSTQDEDTDELEKRLLKVKGVRGKCFVVCFTPNHGVSLPLMKEETITEVISKWQELYKNLQEESSKGVLKLKYMQIFENKGLAMGCSNPHPHGQVWCLDTIPTEVGVEIMNLTKYHKENGAHLLDDYVKLEVKSKERVILQNDSFIVVVPYWALWAFEALVIAKQHLRSIKDFNENHKKDLASILKSLTIKYDNLFSTSFAYSMGIHQAPLHGTEEEIEMSWFHMHFYPPLLKSATIKKFCVGFEMLGEAQRDLTSEQAASRLQELDDEVHYSMT